MILDIIFGAYLIFYAIFIISYVKEMFTEDDGEIDEDELIFIMRDQTRNPKEK